MSNLFPKNGNANSGSLNPLFLYADNVRLCDIPKQQPLTSMDGANAELCQEQSRLSEAQRHRLVKAPKSPTRENELETAYKKHVFFHRSNVIKYCEPSIESAVIQEHEFKRIKTPVNATGCKTIVEFRQWQEAWRIRTQVDCISGTLPPVQSGHRESVILTERGATKIAEACEYMHLKKGGFKTFVTGTFNQATRIKLNQVTYENLGEKITPEGNAFTALKWKPATTIQKEVTRTMDALQKMYQRGWVKKDGSQVDGHSEGLPYLWVVEIPDNENGEPNPHIHLLLGWQVEYKDFPEWAERIENIWGNGYFHLEKIKDASCAGAYMAKAAGYLCKAQDKADQGKVLGNRYGISKTARAPAWVEVCHAQLQSMGQLIYDIYDHLTVKYGEHYRERKRLNNSLLNINKKQKGLRKKVGERLYKVRQILNNIPIRCNKYQLIVKGTTNAYKLFEWLKEPSSNITAPEWLPEKPEGWEWKSNPKPLAKNSQYFTALYKKFANNRFWRRLKNIPAWIKEADSNEFWHATKASYELERAHDPNDNFPDYQTLIECGYA